MIRQVVKGELDGFLLTKTTYYYFKRKMKENPELGKDVRDVALIRREKRFVGENLAGGMLVKSLEDYDHFREYFHSNWENIQGCFLAQLNGKEERFKKKQHPNAILGLFYPFFMGCLGLLAFIACFGVVYEWRRRKCIRSTDHDAV